MTYWRHCDGEPVTDYSDHPRKLVTLGQNSNRQSAGRCTSFFPVGGMPTTSSLQPERLLSEKSGRCATRIKERGALPMIDRGDIRQAIDRCSNIWASLPGAWLWSVRAWTDSLIMKFKEAGGTVREIDVWAESPRLSTLVICIIVCLSWAVNHYRDNAITYKAQRDKNARELKLANAAITDMQMRQRDVAALDAKYEGIGGTESEMMLCVMMLPLVVVGCTSSSHAVSAWSHRLRRG